MNKLINILKSFLILFFLPAPLLGRTPDSVILRQASVVIPKIQPGQPLPANLFVQIGKKLNPTVVNISTRMKRNPLSGYDLLEQFILPDPTIFPHSKPLPPHSLGSGFIIEKEGYIVTNAHVISRAASIRVQIKDDPTTYNAKVIGKDTATDIALIKISASQSRTRKFFPSVTLGDSNALQVGEWVAAFGNPLGHSNTMTTGIISAINRHIDELNLLPFLQTDAGINPGNSGGPLVNTQGQVIAVNTAINPRAQNIGFAIPIHNVKAILKGLKKDGYVKRGFLGVRMNTTPIEFDYKNKSYRGVLIEEVDKQSPAEKGGILPKDIIVEFNGSPIKTNKDLYKIVSATPVNEKVRGKLFREGQIKTFSVVVKERPRQTASLNSTPPSSLFQKPVNRAPFNLGFSLTQAGDKIPKNLNLQITHANRPIVIEVSRPSPAHRAGLRVGDLVFSVNGSNVKTINDVFKRLNSGRQNTIHVLRFAEPGRFNLKKLILIK